MAAVNRPRFVQTFNLKSSDNYVDFIADIRRKLGIPNHFSHNRPMLPPVEPNIPPGRWFHVVLKTPNASLTLTTRSDNLYLEGFMSKDGKWWELTRGIIPAGATYLGFGGSYHNLLGDTDRLTGVTLGPEQMVEAVNVLAAHTAADQTSAARQQKTKDALAVLLLMVHEATRFMTVSSLVAEVMHPKSAKKSAKISKQMKAQVNGWQDLSAALLRTDAHPAGKFTPFKNMGVMTVEQAANTLGILLFVAVEGGMSVATGLRLAYGGH